MYLDLYQKLLNERRLIMPSKNRKNIPLMCVRNDRPMVKQAATKTKTVFIGTSEFRPKKPIGRIDGIEFVPIKVGDVVVEVVKLKTEYFAEVYKIIQLKQGRALAERIEQTEEMESLIELAISKIS